MMHCQPCRRRFLRWQEFKKHCQLAHGINAENLRRKMGGTYPAHDSWLLRSELGRWYVMVQPSLLPDPPHPPAST